MNCSFQDVVATVRGAFRTYQEQKDAYNLACYVLAFHIACREKTDVLEVDGWRASMPDEPAPAKIFDIKFVKAGLATTLGALAGLVDRDHFSRRLHKGGVIFARRALQAGGFASVEAQNAEARRRLQEMPAENMLGHSTTTETYAESTYCKYHWPQVAWADFLKENAGVAPARPAITGVGRSSTSADKEVTQAAKQRKDAQSRRTEEEVAVEGGEADDDGDKDEGAVVPKKQRTVPSLRPKRDGKSVATKEDVGGDEGEEEVDGAGNPPAATATTLAGALARGSSAAPAKAKPAAKLTIAVKAAAKAHAMLLAPGPMQTGATTTKPRRATQSPGDEHTALIASLKNRIAELESELDLYKSVSLQQSKVLAYLGYGDVVEDVDKEPGVAPERPKPSAAKSTHPAAKSTPPAAKSTPPAAPKPPAATVIESAGAPASGFAAGKADAAAGGAAPPPAAGGTVADAAAGGTVANTDAMASTVPRAMDSMDILELMKPPGWASPLTLTLTNNDPPTRGSEGGDEEAGVSAAAAVMVSASFPQLPEFCIKPRGVAGVKLEVEELKPLRLQFMQEVASEGGGDLHLYLEQPVTELKARKGGRQDQGVHFHAARGGVALPTRAGVCWKLMAVYKDPEVVSTDLRGVCPHPGVWLLPILDLELLAAPPCAILLSPATELALGPPEFRSRAVVVAAAALEGVVLPELEGWLVDRWGNHSPPLPGHLLLLSIRTSTGLPPPPPAAGPSSTSPPAATNLIELAACEVDRVTGAFRLEPTPLAAAGLAAGLEYEVCLQLCKRPGGGGADGVAAVAGDDDVPVADGDEQEGLGADDGATVTAGEGGGGGGGPLAAVVVVVELLLRTLHVPLRKHRLEAEVSTRDDNDLQSATVSANTRRGEAAAAATRYASLLARLQHVLARVPTAAAAAVAAAGGEAAVAAAPDAEAEHASMLVKARNLLALQSQLLALAPELPTAFAQCRSLHQAADEQDEQLAALRQRLAPELDELREQLRSCTTELERVAEHERNQAARQQQQQYSLLEGNQGACVTYHVPL